MADPASLQFESPLYGGRASPAKRRRLLTPVRYLRKTTNDTPVRHISKVSDLDQELGLGHTSPVNTEHSPVRYTRQALGRNLPTTTSPVSVNTASPLPRSGGSSCKNLFAATPESSEERNGDDMNDISQRENRMRRANVYTSDDESERRGGPKSNVNPFYSNPNETTLGSEYISEYSPCNRSETSLIFSSPNGSTRRRSSVSQQDSPMASPLKTLKKKTSAGRTLRNKASSPSPAPLHSSSSRRSSLPSMLRLPSRASIEEEPLASPSGLCLRLSSTCNLRGESVSEDNGGLVDEEESPRPRVASPASSQVRALTPHSPPQEACSLAVLRPKARKGGYASTALESFPSNRVSLSRFREEFEEHCVLGHGTYGTVYKCKNRLDGCMYAVKMTKQQFKGRADRERVLKEVFALSAVSNAEENPHIVRYFGAFIDQGYLYIQTELCDMSLEQMIRHGHFPGSLETVCKDMARQVLEGLARLHKNNLVHLDIKPANIFVKNGVFKIGDLGHASCLARINSTSPGPSPASPLTKLDISPVPVHASPIMQFQYDSLPRPPPLMFATKEHERYSLTSTPPPIKAASRFGYDIEEGDSRYMALEILHEDYENLAKGDIFSLGASMYEMALGRELPANGQEWHDIRAGILDSTAMSRFSLNLRELVRLLLLLDPVARPSAEALLASGGPGGILRTEYEVKLAREKAAADDYRKQLAKTITGGPGPLRFRRSNTM